VQTISLTTGEHTTKFFLIGSGEIETRNGAGKTTLFRLIMGLETVDKGEFEVGETVKVAYVRCKRFLSPPESTPQSFS